MSGSRGERGNTYSASMRQRRKTKVKRRKKWSLRRVVSIIGFVAASIAIASLFVEVREILLSIWASVRFYVQVVRDFINSLFAFIPIPWPSPLQGLGDIILMIILIVLVVKLLRVTEPEISRKIDEVLTEMKVTQEVTRKSAKEKAEKPTAPPYVAFIPTSGRKNTLQMSAAAVVNMPRQQVWEMLSEVVYVPTCQELMESVEVLGKVANALTWEGTLRVGKKKFDVEGTTIQYPPTMMEMKCTRGALRGFRGILSFTEVPDGTKLSETVEFDPSALPEEYSPVVNALSSRGSDILVGDLEHYEKLIKALLSAGETGDLTP